MSELAGPLAQRVLADERLELRDDVGRAPELDVGRDPLLDRDEPELVEPPASACAQSSKANSASAGPRQRSSARSEERPALLR